MQAVSDVRFCAHNGLMADIAPCPKTFTITDIASLDNRLNPKTSPLSNWYLFRQLRRQEFAHFQN